jgi:uncharacterized membrane protein YccC
VPSPTPLVPAWLRQELAPHPGRWRQALIISVGSTAAMLVGLWLQFATFPAPLMAFKGLLPSVVHSVALLALRLGVIVGGAVVAVNLTGIGVQEPWLFVPGFFVTLTVITYVVPIRQNPVAGYCLALTVAGVGYTGVFAPQAIGSTALTMAVGFAIGATLAAAFAFARALPAPRQRLADALAAHFTLLRTELAAAGARFRAAEPPPPVALVPRSALTAHLQLLSLVRMQHNDFELERAFVGMITVGERVALFVEFVEACAAKPGGRRLRRLVDAELGALLAGLDTALARYAAVARTPDAIIDHGQRSNAPWPDLAALVAALHARELALTEQPALLAGIDVDESANYHTAVQALGGIAEVLHAPPEAHEALPPDPGPPPSRRMLPPFDKYAAQFAVKIAFACTIALIVGVTSQVQAMETVVLNPLILAQGSYGATLRKAWLRIIGVVLGGLLAIAMVVALMSNTDDVTVWLLAFFAVMLPCAYLALGTERLSYLGVQVAATFMIILVANRPVTDPHEALWRFFGTVVGALVLFGTFQIVVPDYAGRQLVSRFTDLLRLLLDAHPPLGAPMPSSARARGLADQLTAGLADILRLAEESRFEGAASGVDPDAALQAAGVLRRLAHRQALTRRARRTERPPLPAAAAAAQTALEAAMRTRLERLSAMCSARHHRARTDSTRHRAAQAAARAAALATRPDLDAPLAAFVAAADLVRHGDATWSREAVESLMAEVGHLQRIAELLPQLEEQLERALVV